VTEIACPDGCPHLSAARAHPAAAVKRQREHDLDLLLPTIAHLTERQRQLFFVFHSAIARFRPTEIGRLVDGDVADAAAALAATLETSARGVIYEHVPTGRPAQDLAAGLKAVLAEIREHGATVYDHEALVVLKAIEKGARVGPATGGAPENTSYLELMARLLGQTGPGTRDPGPTASRLIVP
jgi:hypothetical protein